MGPSISTPEKTDLTNQFPEGEHYVGFENKTATICYSNSVLQALYYCEPFRKKVLEYKSSDNAKADNPILSLQEVFNQILNFKKKTGCISTKKLMGYVKKNNEMFSGDEHQDTHEFLIWFFNEIHETLLGKKTKSKKSCNPPDAKGKLNITPGKKKTWLEDIFEGTATTQTTCFNCKTVTERDEPFFDLSIDLEQNTSLTYCIKNYSKPEILKDNDKFRCDKCNSLQDAEKKVLIKNLPNTLIIHLKRFKYDEQSKRMVKLQYKIAFPSDIKIDANKEGNFKFYELFAIVIHIGQGLLYGHYVCIIKHKEKWFLFDDDTVEIVDERYLNNFFGNPNNTQVAYLLFYQAINQDGNESPQLSSPKSKSDE